VAELGRGTYSRVYRVRRPGRTGAETEEPDYALKMLTMPFSEATGEALTAFRREAALLASVTHPGIPVVHEVGEANGSPYLVMDLVEGRPLATVLEEGPLTPSQVVQVAYDVAGPLGVLHERGLVHRDVKSGNIVVQPSGRAVLIDFGLTGRTTATRSAAGVGTLAYAPPEQSGILKRAVDGRSDLYALGVVLFEALAGRLPFVSEDVGELVRSHALKPPPDLRTLVPTVGPGLVAVVSALLAKDPDDRYQYAAALEADLALLAVDPDVALVPRLTGDDRPRAGALAVPVGRRQELTRLEDCWRTVRERSGGACVVRGPGGSGKSLIVSEVARRAASAGALVLAGKSFADDPLPLAPLRQALDAHLASVARLGPEAQARFRAQFVTAAGPAAGILASFSPTLAAVLGETPSGGTEDQFTLAVTDLLVGLARESGGLVLVLDDVHWLDETSARVLRELAPRLGEVPLLLLATARDDSASRAAAEQVTASLGDSLTEDLVLEPLDDEAIGGLVAVLMPGADVGTGLASLVAARADGNAFVAKEYLRAIVDAGLLRPDWGRWQLDVQGLDALELPQDAIGLVLTRVRRLGDAARDVLVTAAAIGGRFRPDLVAAVREAPVDDVLSTLAEAEGHGLVEPRDGGEYAFLHDRIREALLTGLDEDAASAVHRRIARELDAAPVPPGGPTAEHVYATASHYLAARPEESPELARAACDASRVAGELALSEHATSEAVRFLRAATDLAEVTGGPADPEFALSFAEALKETGDHDQAMAQIDVALRASRDPLLRARAHLLAANIHRARWSPAEGLAEVSRGLTELRAAPPRNPFLLVASTLALQVTEPLLRRLPVVRTRRAGNRARCELVTQLYSVAAYLGTIMGNPGVIVMNTLRTRVWAQRLGSGPQFIRAQGSVAVVFALFGLPQVARRMFARSKAVAEGPQLAAWVAYGEGIVNFFSYQDNGQVLETGLPVHWRWIDLASFADWAHLVVSHAASQGRVSDAERAVAVSRPRARLRPGEITNLIFTVPHVLAACGRHVEAARALRQVEATLGEPLPAAQAIGLYLTKLLVLTEQHEFGDPFDRTVARYEQSSFPQPPPVRPQRIIVWVIAMGRLAQCRLAAGDDALRSQRLQQARAAVAVLRRAARGDELKARWRVAKADLDVLEERPLRALRRLSGWHGVLAPDMPIITYEAARVRARAFLALGDQAEARYQAQFAIGLAREYGWPHRATWVVDEFGISGFNEPPPGTRRSATSGAVLSGTVSWRPPNLLSIDVALADGMMPGPVASVLERSRLAALEQVSLAASQVIDPDELARIILDEVIRIMAADRAMLFLVDDHGDLVLRLGRDDTGQDVAELGGYGSSLVERVRRTKESLVVTGTEEGAALGSLSAVQHGLRSIMAAPLLIEDRLLGVVYLDSQLAKGIFTQDDAGILMALTRHVATSLETARAAQLEISVRAAQRERDLAELLRLAQQDMVDSDELGDVLARMLTWARRIVGGDRGWLVFDTRSSTRQLQLTQLVGTTPPQTSTIDPDPGLMDLLFCKEPVVGSPGHPLPEALLSAEPVPGSGSARDAGCLSGWWIALPLCPLGNSRGVLVLASDDPTPDLSSRLELAAALVAQALVVFERVAMFAKVQALATVDELTGIINRRCLLEAVQRELQNTIHAGCSLLFLMIDIDHFKAVNDTYGHPTGDDVIRGVVQRFSNVLCQRDTLGRYGGEEFAVLLPGGDRVTELPERLRVAIADEPIATRSGSLAVTISIGSTVARPDDDLSSLLARADEALYCAKRDGRNRVVQG
jgi:diguanylate cyclase (GGDEF)-like protein